MRDNRQRFNDEDAASRASRKLAPEKALGADALAQRNAHFAAAGLVTIV
jgi:hypothetical protein